MPRLAAVRAQDQEPAGRRDAGSRALAAIEAAARELRSAAVTGKDGLIAAALLRLADAARDAEELAGVLADLAAAELTVQAILEAGRAAALAEMTPRLRPV